MRAFPMLLCGCLAASACSSATDPDAGIAVDLGAPPDAGAGDFGPLDAGAADDAALDAGTAALDAGTAAPDAGPPLPDTGPVDLGLFTTDAGPPATEGCFTDVSAGHHVFPCDGITYDVEISAACASGGCGVIFDVHGATMDAQSEDANTNLRALGSAAGYVVVQPTGPSTAIGPQWNPARDDPKVFAFLVLTLRAMRADLRRVHFTGFSQGGFMSWRMLCAHADLLASVAPAAACGTLFPQCAFSATARPSEERPVLYIHGSRDNIVAGCGPAMRDQVVRGWSMTAAPNVSMDANYTWSRYTSASGNVFDFIDHRYTARSSILGGHCLPGSTDIGTNTFGTSGFGCTQSSPITWGAAVLAFFQAHPKP